jgi:hypothetical protein
MSPMLKAADHQRSFIGSGADSARRLAIVQSIGRAQVEAPPNRAAARQR